MPDPTNQPAGNASVSAGTPAQPCFPGFRGIVNRSIGNLGKTFALVRRRAVRKRAYHPPAGGRLLLLVGMCAVAFSFLVLDEFAGSNLGDWPRPLRAQARRITDIGLGLWYILPAALVLLVCNLTDWSRHAGRRLLFLYNWTMFAAFVLVAVGGTSLLANIVDRLIGRARPSHFDEHGAHAFDAFTIDATWASFPSGHASVAGAVAGAVALLWPASRWLVLPAGMVVAATRVVTGSHYPSDVVAGFVFGFGLAVLVAVLFARLGYLFAASPHGWPRPRNSFRLLTSGR